ncbi:hypothetical protein IW147_002251 [Coemansia sp. RSA 720]|nr:hypothetical protein IW147_002251 [Coemansia sp. RSA 720]
MSGQPNLGGLGAGSGDWRATLPEQVRSQHLSKLVGNILQGLSDPSRDVVMKLIYQQENQVYTSANSAQEYITVLGKQMESLAQKVKAAFSNPAANNAMAQSGAAGNPSVSALQNSQFTQPAHTPTLAHAQPQQPAAPAMPQNNMPPPMVKLRETIQNPENSTLQELVAAVQILQAQIGANPAAKANLTELVKRLMLEYQKRQNHAQASMRQQQQQTPQQTSQQVQGAQTAGNVGFSQTPQLSAQQQQQFLQLRMQQQQQQQAQPQAQTQAQFQALQTQPQFAAALANAAQQRPGITAAPAPGAVGNVPPEEMQLWANAFRNIKRTFVHNGTHVSLSIVLASNALSTFRQKGDKHNEALMLKFIHELLQVCSDELKRPIPQTVLQLITREVAPAPAAPANPQAAAGMQAFSSPPMAASMVGTAPAVSAMQYAAMPATSAAVAAAKKQGSGKNSPAVSASKPKKKSQSPRTKARKSPQPQSNASLGGPSALPQVVQSPVPVATTLPASSQAAMAAQLPPISAEEATKTVSEIIASVAQDVSRRVERFALSDDEKRAVRNQLPTLEQLAKVSSKVMPVVFMRTRNRDIVGRACMVQMLVNEQLRILPEDQYIIRPNTTAMFIDILRNSISVAKEWGLMKSGSGVQGAPVDARAAGPSQRAAEAAGQETPLTNMHPGAVTSDPALENFQKAVKHPLDPGSLKLPAAKKRAMGKSGSFVSSPSMAQAGGPTSAALAPAPLMLPPNMSREEFERMPQDMRMAFLKSQQVALIRQHTSGISSAETSSGNQALMAQQQMAQHQLHQQQLQQPMAQQMGPTGQNTNPLLLAAVHDMSSAMPSEDEERLKVLEKDKWSNPLEYLMCVLGKFTKSAEKAGMEPSPILQQAFWPIARKSMSSNWGVVATDAVL